MYCLKCQKNVGEGTTCPVCGEALKKEISLDEKTVLIQALHKQENKHRDLFDRGMSALVLGGIFLIIGFIFFSLSFKLNLNNQADSTRYLRPDSFEFVVAAVSLSVGGCSLIFGIVYVILQTRKLRVLKHDIAEIQESNTTVVDKTGLLVPEVLSNLKVKAKNRQAIKAAEKEKKTAK
jgi:hypothetical protein